MSLISKANAKCTHCGATQEIEVYDSINTNLDPGLKKKVENGSLFMWRCPTCQASNLVLYPTLYHDPDKKLMLWYTPEDNEKVQRQIKDAEEAVNKMSSLSSNDTLNKYTLRRTSNVGDLIEKVLISNAGLDDLVVELCKFVTKMEMKNPDLDFHFYSMEGEDDSRALSFVFPEKGEMKIVKIGYNVYQDCEGIISRNEAMKPEDGFKEINADYINKFLK